MNVENTYVCDVYAIGCDSKYTTKEVRFAELERPKSFTQNRRVALNTAAAPVAFFTKTKNADLKNMKFTLRDNTLSLNAIEAGIDGWVAMAGEAIDMDLKLNTNEIGFKEILSLIPAIYAKDFAGLKTDGVATLNAYAKGTMEGEQLPAFNVDLSVKNAMLNKPLYIVHTWQAYSAGLLSTVYCRLLLAWRTRIMRICYEL